MPRVESTSLPPPEATASISAAPELVSAPPAVTGRGGMWTADGGTAVTVADGETIDTISRRFGIPANSILQANGLAAGSSVRPGQRIVLPRYVGGAAPAAVAAAPAPSGWQRGAQPAADRPAASSPAASARSSVHVVAPAETLTSIARLHGVSVSELAVANNLSPAASVRTGQRLALPAGSAPARPVLGRAPATVPAAPAPQVASVQTPARSQQVAAATPAPIPAAPQTTASTQPVATARVVAPAEAAPAAQAQAASLNFRWPVRGRVISGFGAKTNGQHNDGINLAVPEGTSVQAAEDGTVAYAGSELRGFGNLVLIRHANGYVTAYAHNSELLVKRGDTVTRGQVIARAGQTGNVTSPQVHFEIRRGSTPVDPMPYLQGS